MTVSAQDAHEYPLYNARFRAILPILDADGDLVTGASTPDSEVSQDSGTFADATNEITEIATSSGIYYLDLVATEMDTKSTTVIVKTATAGAKTTVLTLNPRRLPVVRTGTAQAGAASTITLDAGASATDDFYNGCWVNITNNSPANVQGQARKITDYVGSTKVATIEGTWGTNPSSASTFEILAPPEVAVQWAGTTVPDPNTAGYPIATVKDGTGTGEIDTALGKVAIATGGIVAGSFAAGAIDAAAIGTGAIDADAIAADAIGASELATDAVAEIADAVFDEALSGHTTLGTFGQLCNALGLRTGEINDLAATTTSFVVDGFTEVTNDHFNGMRIAFTSGALTGQARTITDYVGATQTVTLGEALTDAPADNDDFVILSGEMGGGDLAKVLRLFVTILDQATGQVDNGSFAAGAIDANAIAANAIGASELAADAASEVATAVRTELTTELGRIDVATSTRASPAQVNAEVVDGLNVDTYTQPGQETPAATQTIRAMIGYLYKAWRNRKTQTGSTFSLFNDDAVTVDQKAAVSDDSVTTDVGEMATGP